MELSSEQRDKLLLFQAEELLGYYSYSRLAKRVKDPHNREIIERIADEELSHYETWKGYTGQDVEPDWGKVRRFEFLSRVFGFTFGIRLLELDEDQSIVGYETLRGVIPEIDEIIAEEQEHEDELIDMLDEESLKYSGSVVLGLNDALVELTGALAGFTLAFQNTTTVALSGLITGIAATLSMAASEYLATSAEKGHGKNPMKAMVYTGIAYIATVIFLILPYLLIQNYFVALGVMLATAVLIIAAFNYYASITENTPFFPRFLRMVAISMGVALLSFLLGLVIHNATGEG